ncbi:Nanos 2 [Merluccius polli]|uniref:Nanos 2 n=1 Tax=Merluccius polli TaxID=89951 RepID=A0AA47MTC8_MERPO|nr:Nanos 2 [Merluccius polli]
MWRDYMRLALTLKRMRDARETERERQIINAQAPQAHEKPQDGGGKDGNGGGKGGNGGGKGGNGGGGVALLCGFCRSNGEAAGLYTSHTLRSREGRVTCPVLRGYTCHVCPRAK